MKIMGPTKPAIIKNNEPFVADISGDRTTMTLKRILGLLALSLLAFAAPALAEPAAAEGGAVAGTNWTAVAAALGLGIAATGGALGQGKIIAAAVESIARNPGASGDIKGAWFLGLVFVESLVVYAFLIALIK
jgi:F-type H+-transporting ATPase subunit c